MCWSAPVPRLWWDQFVPGLRLGESSDNLYHRRVRSIHNFLSGLVLYGMRYVYRIKVWTVERRGLGPCSRLELRSDHRHCGYTQTLQTYRVVQTARCARPSIGQRFHDGIDGSKLFDNAGRGRLRECGFCRAHNTRDMKALAEQELEAIEEEAATGLANI